MQSTIKFTAEKDLTAHRDKFKFGYIGNLEAQSGNKYELLSSRRI
jgi:hypothetical protein